MARTILIVSCVVVMALEYVIRSSRESRFPHLSPRVCCLRMILLMILITILIITIMMIMILLRLMIISEI